MVTTHPNFCTTVPENVLKLLHSLTGFKCPSMSQPHELSLYKKSKWQQCLAATLRACSTPICTLETILILLCSACVDQVLSIMSCYWRKNAICKLNKQWNCSKDEL